MEGGRRGTIGLQTRNFHRKLQKPKKTVRDDSRYSFPNLNQVPLDRNLEQ